MATFVASKFDPETDVDRPVIDSEIEHEGKKWKIVRYIHLLAGEMLDDQPALQAKTDKAECDRVLYKEHATRPAVVWVVWLNEVKA